MDDLLKDLKNNNEKFSDEYMDLMKQYYEKLSTQNIQNKNPNEPDEEGGLVITPTENYCIKTQDANGQKVFLNITSHEKVEAPKEEYILEIENKLGVRLPLSLSEKYEDFDNKGEICQVYDVIFNPNVVKKAENDMMVLQFMVQLVCERVKQRFNQTLSVNNFMKLKNLKYKGKTMRQQRIRVRKGPKIEEIINHNEDNSEKINMINSKQIDKEVNEKGKTPIWNLLILKDKNLTAGGFKNICTVAKNLINKAKFTLEDFNHNSSSNNTYLFFDASNANPRYGQALIYIFELNLISKSVGINLNICDEGLIMNCPKLYSIEINLPFRIHSKSAYSIFDTSERLLYVILPFYEKDYVELQEMINKKNGEKNVEVNVTDEYLYDLIV
jgi:hypothetical protein